MKIDRTTKTYNLPQGGEVTFRSPLKKTVDVLVNLADVLSRKWSRGVVERACRTMRLRMFIVTLQIGDDIETFEPLDELVNQYSTDNRDALFQDIERSLAFLPEGMYCVLDQKAEEFHKEISNQSGSVPGVDTDKQKLENWVEKQMRDRE